MSNSSENIYFQCPGDTCALWQQASNPSHHLFQWLNHLHVARTGNPCLRFQLPLFLAVRSVYSDFYVWLYEGKLVFCPNLPHVLFRFSTLMQILDFLISFFFSINWVPKTLLAWKAYSISLRIKINILAALNQSELLTWDGLRVPPVQIAIEWVSSKCCIECWHIVSGISFQLIKSCAFHTYARIALCCPYTSWNTWITRKIIQWQCFFHKLFLYL